MTVRITLERVGADEIRVTLIAAIQVRCDLGSLTWSRDAPARVGDAGGQHVDASSLQEFLTVEQTAEVLHVSRDVIYHLIRTGQLHSMKVGRLRRISRGSRSLPDGRNATSTRLRVLGGTSWSPGKREGYPSYMP